MLINNALTFHNRVVSGAYSSAPKLGASDADHEDYALETHEDLLRSDEGWFGRRADCSVFSIEMSKIKARI